MSYNRSIIKILTASFVFVFISMQVFAQKKYTIKYHLTDKDTTVKKSSPALASNFNSMEDAQTYVRTLPELLHKKGFVAASIDSTFYDSTMADVFLFLGKTMHWEVRTDSLPEEALKGIDWHEKAKQRKMFYEDYVRLENRLLNYYENIGYPFATVFLENAHTDSNIIYGQLKVERGVQYHIDSIHVYGKMKIKNQFLQHYLNIFNGDIYNRSRLDKISKTLAGLPYLEEQQSWDLTMLGTGATLNLYLQPKRSSEVNALIGFLPGNSITGKTKITADVRLNLKNALGGGESILLNWQQLEAQSPRLDLGFNQPYIFNTPFGIDFSFGMLKKDSSWLLLNGQLGLQYIWSANQLINIFYRVENSYLLQGGLDTNRIIDTRQLPPYIDVSSGSIGIAYLFDNTNYKFNPQKGNHFQITASAGMRKVSRNNDILQLKDPAEPAFDFASLYDTIKPKSYRMKVFGTAEHYFDLKKNSVVKLAANAGWLQSPQVFQNELFRIGGYKLLRGFDEESIYANDYGVLTAEYRYLTGINSFLFGFSDVGFTRYHSNGVSFSNSFVSVGLGLELETKFGLLNLSYAVGKRNDVKFDIRNSSKIHFGYINYF